MQQWRNVSESLAQFVLGRAVYHRPLPYEPNLCDNSIAGVVEHIWFHGQFGQATSLRQ